jgi:hypothetical protein
MTDCTCDGLKQAIRHGVDGLIERNAPSFTIADYINDMMSGQWVECACEASKETLEGTG